MILIESNRNSNRKEPQLIANAFCEALTATSVEKSGWIRSQTGGIDK